MIRVFERRSFPTVLRVCGVIIVARAPILISYDKQIDWHSDTAILNATGFFWPMEREVLFKPRSRREMGARRLAGCLGIWPWERDTKWLHTGDCTHVTKYKCYNHTGGQLLVEFCHQIDRMCNTNLTNTQTNMEDYEQEIRNFPEDKILSRKVVYWIILILGL